MPPGADKDTTHREIGGEDAGGRTIDRRHPARVEHLGDDDDARCCALDLGDVSRGLPGLPGMNDGDVRRSACI